ncbi:MAG: IS21 family transposase, partial [Acidobacteriota bacterium]
MVNDFQVRKLMKLISKGESISVAAAKSGMSEPTARKYSRTGLLPSQSTSSRTYRTRTDPFEQVWPQIEEFLQLDPSIEAVTVFDYLRRQDQGRFSDSQLRTLQRRIKVWKA